MIKMQRIDWNKQKYKEYNLSDFADYHKSKKQVTPDREGRIIEAMKKDIDFLKSSGYTLSTKNNRKKLRAIAHTIPLTAWM